MPERPVDVLAIGNAIVDVIAHEEEAFLERQGLEKGSMSLVEAAEAERIYGALGTAVESSGGSAANTAAGLAALGGNAAFIGKVSDDQLGRIFTHDLRSTGVAFDAAPALNGLATARCLVTVTPDAERTMATYLGASVGLGPADVDEDAIGRAKIVFLEGYLWDSSSARDACWKAIMLAKMHGTKVALTLSDPLCVDRHRPIFRRLLDGWIDVLFANEKEAHALLGTEDIAEAAERIAAHCPIAALTQSEQGSLILKGETRHRVEAFSLGQAVDTTGAGDLYAAGFLHGLTHGLDLPDCGRIGSIIAAESVGHLGARAQRDLGALVKEMAR